MSVVKVSYFSDVLCIWAYIAQARIDAVKENSATRSSSTTGSCSVFGNTLLKFP